MSEKRPRAAATEPTHRAAGFPRRPLGEPGPSRVTLDQGFTRRYWCRVHRHTLWRKTTVRLSGDNTWAPAKLKESQGRHEERPRGLGHIWAPTTERRNHRGSQTQPHPRGTCRRWSGGGRSGHHWEQRLHLTLTVDRPIQRRGPSQQGATPATARGHRGGSWRGCRGPCATPDKSGEACMAGPANPETKATTRDRLSRKSLIKSGL